MPRLCARLERLTRSSFFAASIQVSLQGSDQLQVDARSSDEEQNPNSHHRFAHHSHLEYGDLHGMAPVPSYVACMGLLDYRPREWPSLPVLDNKNILFEAVNNPRPERIYPRSDFQL